MDIKKNLQQAMIHHQADEPLAAEQLYRAILSEEPKHPDANHNLGLLMIQQDQTDDALAFFTTALNANPNTIQFWVSYIDALIYTEQFDVAENILKLGRSNGLEGAAFDQLDILLASAIEKAQLTSLHAEIDSVLVLYANGQIQETLTDLQGLHITYPDTAIFYNLSGACYMDLGQPDIAVKHYQRALEIKPDYAEAYSNLGVAFKELGQLDAAIKNLKQALAIEPDYTPAHYNLGNVFNDLDDPDAAIKSFKKALSITPSYVEAHFNLGNVFRKHKQLDAAIKSYDQVLSINANHTEAHYNLGIIYNNLGQSDSAVKHYRRALEINPDYAEAYSNLGNTFKDIGQLDAAVKSYERALEINPDYAEAYSNLGVTLQDLGQPDTAIKSYEQALAINPDYAEAYSNLGNTFKDIGQLDAAIKNFDEALAINPNYVEGYFNLGNTLMAFGQFSAAIKNFERALVIEPDYVQAHINLANLLFDSGKIDQAIKHLDQAIKINPENIVAYSNRLFFLNHATNYDADFCLKEACKFGEIVRNKTPECFSDFLCSITPERLRVGFVSGDFRLHSVGHFLESVLSQLSKGRVELIAYTTHPKFDDLSARIKPFFSEWKPLYGLNDESAANQIHSDGIHILIDLSGHTANNRLSVFVWKPAPVQISWMGDGGTTGINEMDYMLRDPYVAPPALDCYFIEKIWRLPETFLCFTAPTINLNVNSLPARHNSYVTFGCFNNLPKMNDIVVALWSKILLSVPKSKLLLKAKQLTDKIFCENILHRFSMHGINKERIILKAKVNYYNHMATYHEVDIALDTFPFPGVTTSAEALWMGIPILTKAGDTFLSRAGVSILANVELSDWIAKDENEYLSKAINFASDIDRLTSIRAELREQVLASPLFDVVRFSENFENALWEMWKHQLSENKNLR